MNGTYPLLLLLLFLMFSFLCYFWVNCLKISAEQQWKWGLSENEHNKITSEMLTVNMPSEGSNGTYPLLLLLLLFYFLWCSCVDSLEIRSKQKYNWILVIHKLNKITAEVHIVNTPSGYWMALNLCCCCCSCSIICAVSEESVSIKTVVQTF